MKTSEKILGDFGFIVDMDLDGGTVQFKAFKIEHTEIDGTPIDPELYLEGWVRWDGCMNFMHDQLVYGHFCNVEHLENHCKLFKYVYRTAAQMFIEKDPYLREFFEDVERLR